MSTDTTSQLGTILVVDDNPTNIQVLFDVLSQMSYRVAIAKSGESAIQRLQSYHPDIILLDIMMPGIDGFETCQRLKSDPLTRDIPVIFMTALSDSVDKVKGLSLGAVDYITKPIQHEEALARIRVHLQLRESQKKLENQTTELSQTVETLKQAQVYLVQSEKMSALGQLVAGVAHEISNPINFIHANLAPAEEYIQTLINFINLYQECHPQAHPKIQEWMDEEDIEYVREDLFKLLYSLKVGTERINNLVRSLRNFSRLDEIETQEIDLHEGIESTLLILQHRLKARPEHPGINIIREYGKLPMVKCYPSQLNQVFMNILGNAIDALEERDSERNLAEIKASPSQIKICTELLSNDMVAIYIADNGSGMEEDLLAKIFQPFFTTKPMGKGTGLGLSISYHIITQKHGGKISCYSKLTQGTEFVIKIPVAVNV
jgi:two-component system NtrC family sensor kinase